MDGGASWATVHGVAKSRPQLKQLSTIPYRWLRNWGHLPVRMSFPVKTAKVGLPRWSSGSDAQAFNARGAGNQLEKNPVYYQSFSGLTAESVGH